VSVAEQFIAARPRLLRLAYSQLGDLGEAEDVVQEAWLRLERSDAAQIRDLDAWLTTVVARLALDALRSARARRELYVGPWLPEPLVASTDADPAERVTLDESVSYALLAVLEQLPPGERTAFVLHDVFGMPFEQVADVVGRTPAAVRQLASRGRRHVESERPRRPVSDDEHRRVVEAFGRASLAGDLDALLAVLDPDVVFTSDGGGRAIAARKPLHGAERVARAWIGITAQAGPSAHRSLVDVNGRAGVLVENEGARTVLSFEIDGGRITRIDVMRNPDKLPSLTDAGGGVR
jgi:RNA polymerase sigma-70 factor, ECF subfamily